MRPALARAGVLETRQLARTRAGLQVSVAGMAIVRQRPDTAKGMFFMTLEDEHGFANVVVTPDVFARYRRVARQALFVRAHGRVERNGQVVNLKTDRLEELLLGDELPVATRDFH
jgi:error-prone DNA polymerase